ncbi:hypothetical protein AB0I60_20195 [Actinosynnema sp. NPDC050436]|uniref:hypothetical protein n=1 Tax=Actinosynnema sp. NPDC050436 TaxID=3155659 RepID=UPI0033CE5363
MTGPGQAVHRTIVVVDVEGFGDPLRTLPHQVGTRSALYRLVVGGLRAAGVAWEGSYHEDRGDGLFALIPPEYVKAPLVQVLTGALADALREHNDRCPSAQRIRLRMLDQPPTRSHPAAVLRCRDNCPGHRQRSSGASSTSPPWTTR